MPLKHFTETFLTVVLGAVVALTGLLTATLPSLPDGALPWVILFVLSVAYPLSLHSMFQKRRADNFFRNLHWFPAGMLLVWLLLQGVVLGSTLSPDEVDVYTWGWTLPAVIVGFVMMVLFCLKVIRRRVPRLSFLAAILIPFAALAIVSEQGPHFEEEITALLWDNSLMQVSDSGMLTAWMKTGSGVEKNLDPSENKEEEEWREHLRMQQRREERIAGRVGNANSSSSGSSEKMKEEDKDPVLSGTGDELRNAGTMPGNLPSSGFGWNLIILTMIAAYSATLHKSFKKTA
jgi:hypothetical protein